MHQNGGSDDGEEPHPAAGDSNHPRYIPELVDLVASGGFDPSTAVTQLEPKDDIIDAYRAFDEEQPDT